MIVPFLVCFGPLIAFCFLVGYAVCRASHDADELEALELQAEVHERKADPSLKAHSARLHARSTAPFPPRRV